MSKGRFDNCAQTHMMEKEETRVGFEVDGVGVVPTGTDPQTGEPMYKLDEVDKFMADLANKHVKAAAERMELWKDEGEAAAEALRKEMQRCSTFTKDMKSVKKEFIDTVRAMRMTINSETSQILGPLTDIRKFFLTKDHAEEVERIEQFAEVCERLERLKNSGFLDAVADTMLKLEQ